MTHPVEGARMSRRWLILVLCFQFFCLAVNWIIPTVSPVGQICEFIWSRGIILCMALRVWESQYVPPRKHKNDQPA